jgi:uncharacterized membrane protein
MNGAHLHLILTHLPIVGLPLAVLLLLWGWLRGAVDNQRAALFALVILAALTVGAKLTGEGAEDVLKGLPDYPRPWVHQHEDMADKATVAGVLTGILALLGLLKKSLSRGWMAAILAAGVLSSALLIYTGALGGLVRHTEIRSDLSGAGEQGTPEHVAEPVASQSDASGR